MFRHNFKFIFLLIFCLIFFSGFSGLIYQVAWQKHLSILLGSHASAAAAVLALFFLFLSAGYLVIGRYATRLMPNQLLMYALIELLIGIYGLYSTPLFEIIYSTFLKVPFFSSGGLMASLPLCAAFIGIPTFLMGGTIPVLTQGLSSSFQISGDTHAKIYAINALGAFLGCLIAGLYFLEKLGVDGTLLVAGNINVLVAICAGAIALKYPKMFLGPELQKSEVSKPEIIKPEVSKSDATTQTSPGLENKLFGTQYHLLLISFLSGFYTFSLENLVIKMAGLSIGSTTYVYSIVVAGFILSISLGSFFLARGERAKKPKYFAQIQFLSFLAIGLLFISVSSWPEVFLRLRLVFQSSFLNFTPYLISLLVLISLLLLIPISLVGANLPLLFVLLRERSEDLSKSVGRLYAVNSLGSVLGATLGGYWIFHFVSAEKAFLIACLAVGLAAILAAIKLLSGRLRIKFIVVAIIYGAFLSTGSFWNKTDFVPGYFLNKTAPAGAKNLLALKELRNQSQESFLFNQDDANTFVAVTESAAGDRTLYVNGKPDASTKHDQGARAMATLIPMMLKPDKVEDAFIVGLGGGLSTGLLAGFSEVKNIDVAEISEGVINSLPYFEKFNYGLKDNSEKLNIILGDAYRVLIRQQKNYDLIISEPSNTWVSGVEKLFTKEFYQAASNRLNSNGMYVQWFPLFSMEPQTFRLVLKTFSEVFPYSMAFAAQSGALTLIGTKSTLSLNLNLAQSRFREMAKAYKDFGVVSPQSVWARQVLSTYQVQALSQGIEGEHSLFNTILEYTSGRAFFVDQQTQLQNILSDKLILPPPKQTPGGNFLIYQNLDNIKSSDLLGALKFKSQNWQQFETFILRTMIRKGFEKEIPKESLSDAERINYLVADKLVAGKLAAGKTSSSTKYNVQPEYNLLALSFKKLLAIADAPRLSRLLVHMRACKGEADCLARKRVLVQFLAPEPWSKAAPQLDSNKLDEVIEKIIAAYQRLNYDPDLGLPN